ncbi:hypothetical protein MMC13_005465 [Lambiella insularis]|nr:hypothetical protein [Lambiella insularis]
MAKNSVAPANQALPKAAHALDASDKGPSFSSTFRACFRSGFRARASSPVPIAAPAPIDLTFYPYPLATATAAPHTQINSHGLIGSDHDPQAPINAVFSAAAAGSLEGLADLDWIIPDALAAPPPSPRRCSGGSGDTLAEPWSSSTDGAEEASVSQLSELSIRLYPLYRSSCALMTAAQENRSNGSTIIDDAALGSVVTSLISANASSQSPPSTVSNALQGTLSASRHLLSILCRLQASAVATKSPSSTVSVSTLANTGAYVDPWGTFAPQPPSTTRSNLPEHSSGGNGAPNFYEPRQALTGSMMADSAAGQGRHFDMVVHHLVLACHTLLLNTYGTLLAALQHDADLQRESLLPGAGGNADKEQGEADAATLSDMRLVLVVQLSSYFVDRLHQAVDAYVPFYNQCGREQLRGMPSPFSPPSLSSSRHHNRNRSMDTSASSTADRGAIDDLGMEIRQRLIRLRRTLRV